MNRKRSRLCSSGSSGWMTLLNFILVLIAIGVGISKLLDRFSGYGRPVRSADSPKPAAKKDPDFQAPSASAEAENAENADDATMAVDADEVLASEEGEAEEDSSTFEVPADAVIDVMSEMNDSSDR